MEILIYLGKVAVMITVVILMFWGLSRHGY